MGDFRAVHFGGGNYSIKKVTGFRLRFTEKGH